MGNFQLPIQSGLILNPSGLFFFMVFMINIDKAYSLLEQELVKPEFDVNFLDGRISERLGDVSVVIPTYNRAPYNPITQKGKYNPLMWCIDSLLNQKGVDIDNIIIVDDASDDFTKDTIDVIDNNKLVYLRNTKRLGSAVSRNTGIGNVNSKFVYFLDDDCVSAPYTVLGGILTSDYLKNQGIDVGPVLLPVYYRSTIPTKIRKIDGIGKIDFKEGRKTGDIDAFPHEYLTKKTFIDDEKNILAPIEVGDLNGHFLCRKESIEEVGGFPTFFNWKNNYTEETELAISLFDVGYKVFLSPDPKFHTVHWRYGTGGSPEIKGTDWKKNDNISLTEMAKECENPISDTGNRVSVEEWAYSRILSFIVLFRRDSGGIEKFIERTYHGFVEGKDPYFMKYDGLDLSLRKKIWESAVNDGYKFIRSMKDQEDAPECIEREFNPLHL